MDGDKDRATRQKAKDFPSYLKGKVLPLSENETGLTAQLSLSSHGDLGSLYKLQMYCVIEFRWSLGMLHTLQNISTLHHKIQCNC